MRAKSNQTREGNSKGKRRFSVLSSFSLSRVSVIQVFMLSGNAQSSFGGVT